jgi:hypothetical protein
MWRPPRSHDYSTPWRLRFLSRLTLAAGLQRRFDIDDRRPVDRFHAPHTNAEAIDFQNLHGVKPERVRTIRRAGGEHPEQRPALVVARMNPLHVAIRQMQPGDRDDVGARTQAVERVLDVRFENEPAVRSALVALTWRFGQIGQRRLDPPDRPQHQVIVHI